MKTRLIIVLSVLATVTVFIILGFNSTHQNNDEGENVITRCITPVGILNDKGEIQRSNSRWGNSYAGDEWFQDDIYNYFIDKSNHFIEAIYLEAELLGKGILLDSEDRVLQFFQMNFEDKLRGDITAFCNKSGNNDSIYEIVETVDNIETGTKASIIINEEGYLASAVFLLADYEAFEEMDLDLDKVITAQQAMTIVCEEIQENEVPEEGFMRVPEGKYDARLKTFKGVVFWEITFSSVIYDKSGTSFETQFICRVEATTGTVLEIARSL
ncbi:MAG: hypothetical protein IJ744_05995 [Lachnospiraceae bacterium]|nr:hypothetical protein [Lachnospiraceae bacterium]